MIEWIASLSEIEVAHFSFHTARIAFAATGNGALGGDFLEHAVDPGLSVLRGE